MAEKAKVRAKGNKRTGKLLSSFIVLTILLSVSLVSVATVGAVEQPPEPEVTGITVTADPTSIPMEVGTSTITATVTWANKPTGEGFSIHFELLSPNLGAAIGPAYVSTDASGVATATLAAGLTGGTVTVKASWVGDPGISDTTTVTITEPVEDTTPPYTSGHNPAKDATNVPIDTNIVVHVKDDGAGVDQATIVMTVEGVTVTPVITGSTADYTLTYNPPADFGYEQVVDVTIDASDLAATPNVMPTDAYSFTTQAAIIETIPPYTTGHNPAKDATNVTVDTNIVVHVKDDGAGVNQATIVMTVEGVTVTPVITGSNADCTLTYNPPVDFGYGQVVDVTIDASDLAATPNVMPTDAYSFTTLAEEDTTPPEISNVASSAITDDSATITWDTNEPSDSLVKYGTTPGTYTEQESEAADVTSHSIELTGLTPNTTYYYVVNSTDPSGNSAESDENSFTTGAAPVLTTIEVSPSSVTLKVNDTRQFTATAYDQYSEEMSGVTFAWSVSNGTVGTVNATTGFFEAKALGFTLVNATAEGVTGSAVVTVTEEPRIGDMNGDGNVTFDDAIALAKHVYFGDPVFDDPDVNSDGEVTFDDAILLAKHIYFGDPIYP